MRPVYFSTGNAQKFSLGTSVCKDYDIELLQSNLDIDEVQSEDAEYVARRKAEAAYQLVKNSVVISDDAWNIPGLNGFPGTYAKSVNTWFAPEDYIRLTKDLDDRRILLVQTLVYQDHDIQQLFTRSTEGVLLREPRGDVGVPIQKVVSFEPDATTSISEKIGTNGHYAGEDTLKVWHDFATWYTQV